MGMYTAVSATDVWMQKFGVDVEEIDQYELVHRSASVPDERGPRGPAVARKSTPPRCITTGRGSRPSSWNGRSGCINTMRELIEEWSLDFAGIKGQPEMTRSWCTMDVAEAFLNDPYDWDGPKDPFVCATEADMDGALTMQILTRLSGTPVPVR